MIPKNRPEFIAVAGFFALGTAVVLVMYGGGALFYLGYYAGKTTCPEAISN